MDDNFDSKNQENEQQNVENTNVNKFSMDNNGSIRSNKGGSAVLAANSRTFIILGWVSAALTAFVSPLFAIAGIIFGVLLNRQAKGRGNVIIITNIVLASINILFGLFLIVSLRRMLFGF